MKKPTSALISFLLLCLLLISASAQNPKAKCHPQDQQAIQQIAASFGINFTGDCCNWRPGVECTYFPPYNRVTFYQDGGPDYKGQIPDAIGDLSYLTYLQIGSAPNLIGSIPSTIAKLSMLTSVAISFTGISGPIPTFHENLVNFTYLELRDNALTGTIPSEITSWFPNLKGLALENNKLTGTIPESLGRLTWLSSDNPTLNLANNSLTGTIPKSLGNLDPYYLDLSGNSFTGDASVLFGINKTTQYLYLHGNNFNFDLSKVLFAPSLKEIDLSYNNIFGSLPQQMTQLQFLRKLDVSHNMLCGEIPQGGLLQGFKSNRFANNKCLCGAPLPPCVKVNHTQGV